MFALLEHETSAAAGVTSAERGRHWDLLVEVPGCERLLTWRLARNPLADAGEIPARRIGDHRRLYLEYEGEISGGRGLVRRIDDGAATIEGLEDDRLRVVLAGQHLRGTFEITTDFSGEMVFRRVQEAPRPGAGLPI
jgi:hypothetical protein